MIAPLPEALTEPPEMGPLVLEVQLYVVPPMFEVGVKPKVAPLHIVVDKLVGVFVIVGVGLTVTVTSKGLPEHPFADGVIL